MSSGVGGIATFVASTLRSRMLKNIDPNLTLIFDDLERSSMSYADALSCVNELVEHQGVHAIVLCNEGIPNTEKSYRLGKEKTISYTYNIEYDLNGKVDIGFGRDLLDLPILEQASKAEFKRLLENIECNNLRTLKLAASSYSRLIRSLHENNHDKRNDENLTKLIFPCFAFAIGFKDLGLTPAELIQFSNKGLSEALDFRLAGSDDDDSNNLRKFTKEVVYKDHTPIYIDSAFKLVCLGLLDFDSLSTDILMWEPAETDFKKSILRGNYNFSDSEFERMAQELIVDIRSKKLPVVSAEELADIVRTLHHLVKMKAINYDLSALKGELKEYVDHVMKNKKLKNFELLSRTRFGDEGFVAEVIKKIYEQSTENKTEVTILQQQKALLTAITSSDLVQTKEAYDFLYGVNSTGFIVESFVENFFDAIEKSSPSLLNDLYQYIRNRYQSTNISSFLEEEESALRNLSARLSTVVSNRPNSLTKYQLIMLTILIENILTERYSAK
jgi:hypothetical protein